MASENRDGVPECVEQDGLDLELVLVVRVPLCEVAELLGKVEAMVDVLWGDKVFCHLDAVVQVSDLVCRPRRDEDGVAGALDYGVTCENNMTH